MGLLFSSAKVEILTPIACLGSQCFNFGKSSGSLLLPCSISRCLALPIVVDEYDV